MKQSCKLFFFILVFCTFFFSCLPDSETVEASPAAEEEETSVEEQFSGDQEDESTQSTESSEEEELDQAEEQEESVEEQEAESAQEEESAESSDEQSPGIQQEGESAGDAEEDLPTVDRPSEEAEHRQVEEAVQPIVGSLAYLEGQVDVNRNGSYLDWALVDIGLDMLQYDLLVTGSDGSAEVEVQTPSSREMRITVHEDTAFFFELGEIDDQERTQVELLMGSLALVVERLNADGEVLVNTEYASMGVRGTEFTVTASPGGSLLVTCSEGEVACEDSSERTLYAIPGQGVEKLSDGTFRTVPIGTGRETDFRSEWFTQQIEVFRSNALQVINFYADLYNTYLNDFRTQYTDLMSHRDIFVEWGVDEEVGRRMSLRNLMEAKQQVNPELFAIRRTMFMFQRVYYRLNELARYHQAGYGSGTLESGMSTAEFFRRFQLNADELERKMGMVRYILRLYAYESGSLFPLGDFFNSSLGGDDFYGEDSFFGDDEFFGGGNPLSDDSELGF
ncbi:MAG: FecR domain-containing protein [Spirochaetia bacterium]